MVFQDISADTINYHNNQKNFASAQDRFVSSIVDLIIVLPFALLINFPLIKKMKVVEIFYPLASEYIVYFLSVALISIVIFIFYQAIFLYRYQATFGQMLFKLKVIDTTSDSPLLWTHSLIRSVAFVFNFIFFGLPLLEILSHPKRQAMHDKISDTAVVTLKKQWMPLPLMLERSFIRLFLSTFFFVFCFWGVVIVTHVVKKADQHLFSQSELIQKNMLCSQVQESESNRLKKSIELFLAKIVSRDCVEQEMQFEYAKQSPNEFAPIAGLYINLENDEFFNMYYEQVCKKSNQSICTQATFIKMYKDKKLNELREALLSENADLSLLSHVWLASVYYELSDYKKSDEVLQKLVLDQQLYHFALIQKFKNLVQSGFLKEAEGVYFAMTPYFDQNQNIEIKNEVLKVMEEVQSKNRQPSSISGAAEFKKAKTSSPQKSQTLPESNKKEESGK